MNSYDERTIKLPDGYEAYARYWPAENARAAVLHLHGIQSHCGWYTHTAKMLQEAGFTVLQPDRRGSGHNDRERGHATSAEQLIEDGLTCLDRLREWTGEPTAHVIGVSWGGKLAAAMHVTRPDTTASLAMIAPGIYPIVDVSATEKFRIGWSMLADPSKRYDIPLNDPELFTDKPDWIRFLQEDPLQIHQASAGFFLASRRMDKICARLHKVPPVPLHVFLAGVERIIDNEKTRQMVRDLDWPHRRVTEYDHSRHTLEFGDDRDEHLGDLIRWLRDPAGESRRLERSGTAWAAG